MFKLIFLARKDKSKEAEESWLVCLNFLKYCVKDETLSPKVFFLNLKVLIVFCLYTYLFKL